jgi:peptidoglycan/xylan/chitin deacetylase (PgdA/CDA1 family)
MTRNLALLILAAILACVGCQKIKLPFIKKKEVVATPAPAAVRVAAAATTPAPAVAATPPAPPVAKPEPSTKANAIVLCYHRFEDRPRDALAIKPSEFEEQMHALKDNGFTVIRMQDFLAWRRGEKEIPEKSCVISIDDGYRSGYEVAWPILKKLGYPFTMFIYTNYVKGQPNAGGQSLAWEELAEMRDAGVDIQSHTVTHTNLRQKKGKYQQPFASYEDWLRHELVDSKKMLEQQLGISVSCLAYPYGIHSDEIRKIVSDAGYEAAFTVYGQRIGYNSHADQLGRYAIESSNPKVFADALKMVGGGGGGSSVSAMGQFAAASMVTQPMEGETINNPHPTLKANLAAMGEIDPNSVEIRLSGIGQLPVKYDPASKTAEATVAQKLRDKNYTVILSAKVKGRKVETRWNFNFAPEGTPAAPGEAPLPPRAASRAPAPR